MEFNAELGKDEIIVHAKIKEGKKVVHEINHAFPMDTPEEVIREEMKKAEELYHLEKQQKEEQAKVDAKLEKAQQIVNNLNSK